MSKEEQDNKMGQIIPKAWADEAFQAAAPLRCDGSAASGRRNHT